MISTTQHTIDRWTAQGRRFVPSRPSTATHRTTDTSRLYQEVTATHPHLGLRCAHRMHMRTARASTPVEQTEQQLAAIAATPRLPRDSRDSRDSRA